MTTQSMITIKPTSLPATFTPAAQRAMYKALERAHVVIRDAITLRVPIDGDAEGTLEAVEAALRLALDGAQ